MITCHIILFHPNVFVSPDRVKPGLLHVESTKNIMQCTLPSVIADIKLLICPHMLWCCLLVCGGGGVWAFLGIHNLMYKINEKSQPPPQYTLLTCSLWLIEMPLYCQTTVYLPLLTRPHSETFSNLAGFSCTTSHLMSAIASMKHASVNSYLHKTWICKHDFYEICKYKHLLPWNMQM